MLFHDGLRIIAAENACHSSIFQATPSDILVHSLYSVSTFHLFANNTRFTGRSGSPVPLTLWYLASEALAHLLEVTYSFAAPMPLVLDATLSLSPESRACKYMFVRRIVYVYSPV